MKSNHNDVSGVINQTESAKKYQLRRYFPEKHFNGLIEQFWLVNWQLGEKNSHIQKNLPDANFHLVFEQNKLKILGPISKTYSYNMNGNGQVIGVKFSLGALANYLTKPLSHYVDQEISISVLPNLNADNLTAKLSALSSDEEIVSSLQSHLKHLVIKPTQEIQKVNALVELIKSDSAISKVEHLAEKSHLSVRTIQRYFQNFVGLSPKWLIRKYRLHHALTLLDKQEAQLLDIVSWLGYTDQSHLIRDFKEMIGVTPNSINL